MELQNELLTKKPSKSSEIKALRLSRMIGCSREKFSAESLKREEVRIADRYLRTNAENKIIKLAKSSLLELNGHCF